MSESDTVSMLRALPDRASVIIHDLAGLVDNPSGRYQLFDCTFHPEVHAIGVASSDCEAYKQALTDAGFTWDKSGFYWVKRR